MAGNNNPFFGLGRAESFLRTWQDGGGNHATLHDFNLDAEQVFLVPRRSRGPLTNTTRVSRAAIDAWKAKRENWMLRANYPPQVTDVALTTTWDDLPTEMQTLVIERLDYEANDYRNKFQWFLSVFGFYFLSHTNKATRALVSKIIPLVGDVALVPRPRHGVLQLHYTIQDYPFMGHIASDAPKSVTQSSMRSLNMSCLCLAVLASNNPALNEYANAIDEHMNPSTGLTPDMRNQIEVRDEMRTTGFSNSPAALVAVLDAMGYVGGDGLMTDDFIKTQMGLHTQGGELICTRVDNRGSGVHGALMTAFEGAIMGGQDKWAMEIWDYIRTLGVGDNGHLMAVSAAHGCLKVFCTGLASLSDVVTARETTNPRVSPLLLAVQEGQVQMVRFILEDAALFTEDDIFGCTNVNQETLESTKNKYVRARGEAIKSLLMTKMTPSTYKMWATAPNAIRRLPVEIIDKIMDDNITKGHYAHWPETSRSALLGTALKHDRMHHVAKLLVTMNSVPDSINTLVNKALSISTLEMLASIGVFKRFPDFASSCVRKALNNEASASGEEMYNLWQFLCDKHGATLGGLHTTESGFAVRVRVLTLIKPNVRVRLPWLVRRGFELARHMPLRELFPLMRDTPWEQIDMFDFLFTTGIYTPNVTFWSEYISSPDSVRIYQFIKRWHVDLRVHIDLAAFVQMGIARESPRLLLFLKNELGATFDAQLLYAAIQNKAPIVSITALVECGCPYDLDVMYAICATLDADASSHPARKEKKKRHHDAYMKRLREYLDILRGRSAV